MDTSQKSELPNLKGKCSQAKPICWRSAWAEKLSEFNVDDETKDIVLTYGYEKGRSVGT